jgi:hypothetical protein
VDDCIAASIRDWLAAIGTAAAAILALYIGVIRERLRRPQLSLHFERGTSDTIVVGGVERLTEDSSDVAYLRLRVRNRSGRVTAEDVEVTITGARELQLEGPQVVRLDGLPLGFSNTAPTATRMHVSPGGERHVDLAHIELDRRRQFERAVWIDVHPRPADRQLASMGHGVLELELTVTARDVDAVRHVLELRFTGEATDDGTLWDRLQVTNFRMLK